MRLWDAATGREVLKLEGRGGSKSLAFSPDGHRLATGDWRGTIKIWDARPIEPAHHRE